MASLLPTPEPPDPVEGAFGHFEHSNWVKQALKNLDAGTVHAVGGSAGALAVSNITVDNPAGQDAYVNLIGDGPRSIWGKTGANVARWLMNLGDATAETGSHTGSLFGLYAYGDDGSLRHTVLAANRQTGLLTVAGNPTAALGVATKQYVDSAMPLGAIIAFGGSAAPTGWHLCDGSVHGSSALQSVIGSANAPDLRGLFVVGAGKNADVALAPTTYAAGVGTKSGKETVLLTEQESGLRNHGHTLDPTSTDHYHTGSTGGHSADHSHAAPGGYQFALTTPPTGDWSGISAGTSYHGVMGYVASTGGASADHTHGFTTNWQSQQLGNHMHSHNLGLSGAYPANVAHENRPPYYALVYIIKKA